MYCVKLQTPARFDICTDFGLRFLEELRKDCKFDISIEEPLPNAKLRGVEKVVFLDKHLIKNEELKLFLNL